MRFKADDGSDFPEWEKRTLGDLFSISAGGDLNKGKSSSIKTALFPYPVYANARINNGLHSFANYYVVSGNSFTVTGRGDVGYAVARHDKYVPIVRLLVCKPLHSENVDFFAELINQTHIFVESTGVPQLTVPQLSALFVSVPSLPEQQKIASLLTSADETLYLCQRKLDLLTQAKKALIYNLFPRKGESEPRIRLAGFSGVWALEHVGSFLQESFEKGHTGEEARRLTVKLWGKGIEPKNSPFTGSSNTQYYVRHAGQLMYGKLDFLHAAFGIVPSELDGWESTLDSPAFDVKDANPYFLLYIFLQPEFYLHHGQIANGSRKAKRIHPALFFQMPIRIPSRDEQDAIVELLSSADALIDQARVELEQWQEVKKSLLQQLFV